MPHPWIPNDNPSVIDKMNKKLGIREWKQLFTAVPSTLFLEEDLDIGDGKPLTNYEIEYRFQKVIGKNRSYDMKRVFSGEPICPHYTQPVTEYIVSRGEFLTAYTPYQPEINQGILQSLYEYQSMMALIYGVDIVNSGMYDGATALAEAALMAIRLKKRRKILMSRSLFPSYTSVLETYLGGSEAKILFYNDDSETGEADERLYETLRKEKPDALIIDYPSCLGIVRKTVEEAVEEAHRNDALAIVFSDPTALGVLRPPGEMGADIVVGEGQALGIPMYHGGSTLGIIGIKEDWKLIRNLPGRLVGKTIDVDGREGYMLILQTREQHIRREKATSNITTNTALNAIAAAVNLAVLGEKGFRSLSRRIFENTFYLKSNLEKLKLRLFAPKGTPYKRITYQLPGAARVLENIMKEKNMIPFSILGKERVQTCVTEIHGSGDIDMLTQSLSEEVKKYV